MESWLKFLLFSWILLTLFSCSKDDEQLPSVTIIRPTLGDSFLSGDTIQVEADIRSAGLRFIETRVTVDSSRAEVFSFTDTLSLRNISFTTRLLIETAAFADYTLSVIATDRKGNIASATTAFNARPN